MPNSKKKGNRGENLVCKLLQNWWGCTFRRSLESGAISTLMEQRGGYNKDIISALKGDVMAEDKDFPFYIESKNYAEIDLYAIIRNPDKNLIDTWWIEAKKQCPDRKWPLLMIHEDRKSFFVVYGLDSPFGMAVYGLDNISKNYRISEWDKFAELLNKERIKSIIQTSQQGSNIHG